MNTDWKSFLLSNPKSIDTTNEIGTPSLGHKNNNRIYSITNLAALEVRGKDATVFLQGQCTCNVNDCTSTLSLIGAFCNAKGRVVTTFLLIKRDDHYILVLPIELLPVVQQRLQMYVLRSDVKISAAEDICLIGLQYYNNRSTPLSLDYQFVADTLDANTIRLSLPLHRYLILAETSTAIALWSRYCNEQKFVIYDNEDWLYQDIISGLPWLSVQTSEEYTPQMLNLDKLGGISFTKGCYTGQEVVARSHYLGTVKKEMILSECCTLITPEPNTAVVFTHPSSGDEEIIGKVLLAVNRENYCKMLIIIKKLDVSNTEIWLKDDDKNKIALLRL